MNLQNISWTFVCQSGRLEREACVLAASLRRILGREAKLIAAVPHPESVMGRLDDKVLRFLDSIDVQRYPFVNSLIAESLNDASQSALMMNKAFTLRLDPDSSIVVFLDSDQLCHAIFDLANLSVPMLGRRVFYPGARAADGIWQRAFDLCETELPFHRQLIRSRNPSEPSLVTPPYFNSGFISVHRPWVHELVTNYLGCYERIVRHDLLGRNRYYHEQLALAIAVIKSKVPYEIDNHRLDSSFFHYYKLERLAMTTPMAKYVVDLVNEFDGLKNILADDTGWDAVLRQG